MTADSMRRAQFFLVRIAACAGGVSFALACGSTSHDADGVINATDGGVSGAAVSGDSGDSAMTAVTSAIPFSATGPWRAKLAATTPIATNSAAVVAQIQADITKYDATWSINTDTFSSPYFDVPAGTPTENWTWSNCQKQTGAIYPAFAASLLNIPTLPSFLASKGTDSEIAIYSAETDTYWDFWVAAFDGDAGTNGQWSACYGGVIEHASTNPGIFANGLGATAAGLPLGGWLLRIAELQAGVIDHALGFQMVSTRATVFSWPGNRTDGKSVGDDYPMEGQRFRLDPTFDTSTLPKAAERTIAKALQDYGMILTDTSGAVTMQAEDPRPYMALHGGVNPYPAIWSNVAAYSVLKDIPIARLQALPQDYGKDFMN